LAIGLAVIDAATKINPAIDVFKTLSMCGIFSTCTVEITQYALNQRSPAEGKGKGQKLLART
jgi:hypothetical protein